MGRTWYYFSGMLISPPNSELISIRMDCRSVSGAIISKKPSMSLINLRFAISFILPQVIGRLFRCFCNPAHDVDGD